MARDRRASARDGAGRHRDRTHALLGLTAVLLAPAALMARSQVPTTATSVVVGTTTALSLLVLTVWTARALLPPGVLTSTHHTLDLVGAVLLVPALALAFALRPLVEASSLPVVSAASLVVVPALAALVLAILLSALHLYRGAGTLTTILLTSVLTAVLLTWTAGALVAGRLALSTAGWVVLGAGGAGAMLALLALALVAPSRQPARAPRDEMVLYGRLGQLAVIAVLLGIDHAVALPTVAVVLALASMAVHLAGITLVHARLDSLGAGRRRASTDELTGLDNRRVLTEALAGVDAGGPLSLVLLDLDRFTGVNGAVGQHAGDELLRQVAGRLRHGAGNHEVALRLGSDEFALLMPGSCPTAAMARARALVLAMAAPFEVGGRTLGLSASIGVSSAHCAGAQASTGEELLRQAQLDAGGALVGIEALVRWERPTRGTMAPFAFLPLVAREGLMDALTEQVLRRALALVAGWEGATGVAAPRVSVNISATSLLDEQLVATVAGALVASGVAPDRLVLEVTETELMADPQTSRRVLAALVALGVDISIDDYGTGHSSLAYLKDLPVGEPKLDRSFVADLSGGDPRSTAIVRTTVDLAHSLGLRLVAEGVEDGTTLTALLGLGVDVTQGYHHGRPMPAADVVRWAAARSRTAQVAR